MKFINIEEIRKYVQSPKTGHCNYGKWGTLSAEQRRIINDMCDWIEYLDETVKNLIIENENLKNEIKKEK